MRLLVRKESKRKAISAYALSEQESSLDLSQLMEIKRRLFCCFVISTNAWRPISIKKRKQVLIVRETA